MAKAPTLDLSAPEIDLVLYRGGTDSFSLHRQDTSGTVLTMSSWTTPVARWKPDREGDADAISWSALIAGDTVVVTVTPAQKEQMTHAGYFEVFATDDSSKIVMLATGECRLDPEVGA